MADLNILRAYLGQADSDIATTESRVSDQHRSVQRLRHAEGLANAARSVLAAMESTLVSMRNHRGTILQAIEAHERAPPIPAPGSLPTTT